eukprot:6218290-Pyramimonas_sp.AAC.1
MQRRIDKQRRIDNFAGIYKPKDILTIAKPFRAPRPDGIADDLAMIAPGEILDASRIPTSPSRNESQGSGGYEGSGGACRRTKGG